MKQLAIQVVLIVGILAIAWRLLGSYGQRAQALRRIGLLLFAAFAVWSILDPNILNRVGRLVGIGRGADLVLYGLVLAFLGFVVTTFRRFRDMEMRYTRLARRIALDETRPPTRRSPAEAEAAAEAPETKEAEDTTATPEAEETEVPAGTAATAEADAPNGTSVPPVVGEATETAPPGELAAGIPDIPNGSGEPSATPHVADNRLGTG